MEDSVLPRFLRLALTIVIIVNITMVLIASFMYPPLLSIPGSNYYILKLLAILLLYCVGVLLVTKSSTNLYVLRTGTLFGILGSILEIIHILMENYGHLNQSAESISTGLFMVGLFLLFGLSGFVYTYEQRSIKGGIFVGTWSSVVCMLIVMTFGLSQLFWSFNVIESRNNGNPDFIRSGWTDIHAFTIADIFEASFKILSLGPVLGIIFGLIGASLFWVLPERKRNSLRHKN